MDAEVRVDDSSPLPRINNGFQEDQQQQQQGFEGREEMEAQPYGVEGEDAPQEGERVSLSFEQDDSLKRALDEAKDEYRFGQDLCWLEVPIWEDVPSEVNENDSIGSTTRGFDIDEDSVVGTSVGSLSDDIMASPSSGSDGKADDDVGPPSSASSSLMNGHHNERVLCSDVNHGDSKQANENGVNAETATLPTGTRECISASSHEHHPTRKHALPPPTYDRFQHNSLQLHAAAPHHVHRHHHVSESHIDLDVTLMQDPELELTAELNSDYANARLRTHRRTTSRTRRDMHLQYFGHALGVSTGSSSASGGSPSINSSTHDNTTEALNNSLGLLVPGGFSSSKPRVVRSTPTSPDRKSIFTHPSTSSPSHWSTRQSVNSDRSRDRSMAEWRKARRSSWAGNDEAQLMMRSPTKHREEQRIYYDENKQNAVGNAVDVGGDENGDGRDEDDEDDDDGGGPNPSADYVPAVLEAAATAVGCYSVPDIHRELDAAVLAVRGKGPEQQFVVEIQLDGKSFTSIVRASDLRNMHALLSEQFLADIGATSFPSLPDFDNRCEVELYVSTLLALRLLREAACMTSLLCPKERPPEADLSEEEVTTLRDYMTNKIIRGDMAVSALQMYMERFGMDDDVIQASDFARGTTQHSGAGDGDNSSRSSDLATDKVVIPPPPSTVVDIFTRRLRKISGTSQGDVSNPIKAGILKRRVRFAAFFGSWEESWVVLTESGLYIFELDDDHAKNMRSGGSETHGDGGSGEDLSHIHATLGQLRGIHRGERKNDFSFSVVVAENDDGDSGAMKTHLLKADNAADQVAWVQAIEAAAVFRACSQYVMNRDIEE